MRFTRRFVVLGLSAATLAAIYGLATVINPTRAAEEGDRLVITLERGDVVIALHSDVAPRHVEQVKAIAAQGGYDNVAFHRVIEGFMAQTGDVEYGDLSDGYDRSRVGTGGSPLGNIAAEFSDIGFKRGTVGMARSQHPDSASSQFFIMFDAAPHLNGQYTVIGEVISGMEYVDAIRKGEKSENGTVADPDRMIRVRVVEAE